jgi:hypothetical protein
MGQSSYSIACDTAREQPFGLGNWGNQQLPFHGELSLPSFTTEVLRHLLVT